MTAAVKIFDIPAYTPTVNEPVKHQFFSQSGNSYEIRLGKDDVAYCTCPAWKFSGKNGKVRTCKHLQALERKTFDDPSFEPFDGMVL